MSKQVIFPIGTKVEVCKEGQSHGNAVKGGTWVKGKVVEVGTFKSVMVDGYRIADLNGAHICHIAFGAEQFIRRL